MNIDHLKGMKCPKCNTEGPFQITVITTVEMHDDGYDPNNGVGGIEWDGESRCHCYACLFDGRVKEYRAKTDRKRCPHNMFYSGAGRCPACGQLNT
jgi:hypothetical protein